MNNPDFYKHHKPSPPPGKPPVKHGDGTIVGSKPQGNLHHTHDYNDPRFPFCRPIPTPDSGNGKEDDDASSTDIKILTRTLLGTEVTLKTPTGVKAIKINEEDKVSNLVYLDKCDVMHSVSGIVRCIKNVITAKKTVTEECAHETTSNINKRVKCLSLVVDCSTENHSDIRTIPLDRIIDFEENTLANTLDVSGVKLINISELSFICNEKPAAVIWNGNSVPFSNKDANDDIYSVEIDTMKKTNTLSVITATSMFTTSEIPTIYPYPISADAVTAKLNEELWWFMDSGNVKEATDVVEIEGVNVLDRGVPIIHNVGKTDSIVVNGMPLKEAGTYPLVVKCSDDETVTLSCKNFSVKDGTLYLSAPMLLQLVDPVSGILSMELGDFDVTVETTYAPNQLLFVSATPVGSTSELPPTIVTKDNCVDEEGNTYIQADLYRYDYTTGIGFKFASILNDGTEIPEEEIVLTKILSEFMSDSDGFTKIVLSKTTTVTDAIVDDIPAELIAKELEAELDDTELEEDIIPSKKKYRAEVRIPNYGTANIQVTINTNRIVEEEDTPSSPDCSCDHCPKDEEEDEEEEDDDPNSTNL